MSFRLEDFKERVFSIASEFKGERMGLVGLSIIIFILIVALAAPFLASGVDGGWADRARWEDNPRLAEPSWADYILPGSRAPHDIRDTPDEYIEEARRVTQVYNYENEYDYTLSDIQVRAHGFASVPSIADAEDQDVVLTVTLERPDGNDITFISGERESVSFPENETTGTFTRSFRMRSSDARDTLYSFGQDFHDPDIEMPEQGQITERSIAFAKADGNILVDPEPLKGTYNLTIEVRPTGEIEEFGLDEDESRVIFGGRKYGLMGTDYYRRDLTLGWMWGARWALIIGGVVSISSVAIALLYGMTSAYYGGWVDEFMQRLNEILIGIPMFPILIITLYILGTSIWIFVALYTILGWRGLAKIIRSRGIQIRQDTYIEAAQALGSSGGRVITRHMIPQILPYAIAEGALMVPMVIIAEAGLAVLGLGDPGTVTWGRMLSEAHGANATVNGQWWWVIFPGIGITLVGFAFIATGMALERVINPKMRQR